MGSLSEIRERHRLRVVDVLQRGAVRRAELAAITGLSRTTTAAVLADLLDTGFAVETEEDGDAGRPGRRPKLIRLDPGAFGALGVDIGRRHVRIAIADLAWTIRAERAAELSDGRSPAAALELVTRLAHEVLEEARVPAARVAGAVVALPGPVDRGRSASDPLLREWKGVRAAEELSRRLGMPVELDNDANLAAYGEMVLGAARGLDDLVYVQVSWGIGAGIVLGRRLHRGSSGLAGEIGHVQIEPDGDLCACGSRGCLGTVAAIGPLLALLRPVHGDDLELARMLQLAAAGDPAVGRVLSDAGRAIGRPLADLCNAVDPGAIVVGGELAVAGSWLLDGIRAEIRRHALPEAARAVRVMAGGLGPRARLLGALATTLDDGERLRSQGLLALAGVRVAHAR